MSLIADVFGYLLNALYTLFSNYGLALIIFSVILKILLLPLTIKQQKTMKKSAQIQTELQEIQKKYKSNPEKLNQETIELYKREKMSPFSGCLGAIIQIVLLLAVFYLVSKPLTHMKKVDPQIIENYTNEIVQQEGGNKTAYPEIKIIQEKGAEDETVNINMNFLGIDLSKVPTQSLNDPKAYIIPVLYVISSFVSIQITTRMQKKKTKEDKIIINEDGKEEMDPAEAVAQANKSMSYIMPIMSVSIAIIAPLGLALYWLVNNVLMIIERLVLNKFFDKKEEEENA